MGRYQNGVLWLGITLIIVRFLTSGQKSLLHNVLGAGTANTTPTQSKTTGTGIIGAAFEMITVGIIAVLAGINDDWGKAMILVMGCFWLIFLITNQTVVSTFGSFVKTSTGN